MRPFQFMLAAVAASAVSLAQANIPCFESNLGTNLGAGDDTISAGNALGFSFPFAGGTVTSIDISSNGFVWLGSNTDPRCCDGTEAQFLADPASIAVMWEDLYAPGAGPGGGVFFNTFPAAGGNPARAVVTWYQVPDFATGQLVTAQLQLLDTGEFIIAHDGANQINANNFNTTLVGVTEGNGAAANFIDLSTVGGSPVNTGTTQTGYEVFDNTNYDIAGRNFDFVPNGSNGYIILERTACRSAGFRPYGLGCPTPPVVYEFFTNSTFDLSNQSILFIPNGNGGWAVIPGSGQFFNGFTNNLNLSDDSVATATMPFTFNHPAGSTSSLDVCSNGRIWLSSNPFGTSFGPFVPDFLNDPACIAPMWADFNPSAGGAVYGDADPSNTAYYVTWSNVPMFGTGGSNTMQVALFANGQFELRYQSVTNNASTGGDAITGYSVGGGALDPGSRDLSASVPFNTGGGGQPLTLSATAGSLPQIGTTFSMDVTNIAAGSPLGFMVLGFTSLAPGGVDLTPLGMPGCTQWVAPLSTFIFPVSGSSAVFPLTIPNNSGLVGLTVFGQSATYSPGANPLNVLASNGGEIDIGI